jgi:hypothetical protein
MSIKSSFPTDSPSLVLDFANSRKLDPRITFTRAQTGNVASYMGPDGLVKYAGPNAPRFDHRYVARTNLIPYSEDFSTAWSSGEVTITTDQIANPLDGATTADKYVATTTLDRHRVQQSIGSEIGIEYTGSVYVKSAGADTVSLRIGRSGFVESVLFNILSGTVTSEGSSITSSSIENAGGGWFRIAITNTPAITGTQYFVISEDEQTTNFSGDGVNGFYFWGAQLEKNDTATAYIPTTSAPATESYMESLGLLIEESRANLATYSTDLSANYTAANGTLTANQTISPSGETNAALLTQSGTTTTYLIQSISSISYTSGTKYTFSAYVKKYSNSDVNEIYILGYGTTFHSDGNTNCAVKFNLDSVSAVVSSGLVNSYSITDVGNGWRRISATFTAYATETKSHQLIRFVDPGATSNIYVWGYQVEAGEFATSYIPTSAGAVTRNADDVRILNEDFQSFYNQSEGTFIVESELIDNLRVATSTFNRFFQVSDSSISVGIGCYLDPTNNNVYVRRRIDDSSGNAVVVTSYFIDQSPPPNYTHFSISYSDKNYAFCGNGEDVSKDYTTTTHRTDNTTLNIGRQPNNLLTMLNGTMKKLMYYPLQLSSAQLQTLTK